MRIGSTVELLKYVQKYLDELPSELSNYERDKIEEVYLLIAGLFGIYPTPTWRLKEKYTNLGRSLLEYDRKFNKEKPKDDSKISSTEKRLMLLLRANDEDFPEYLRQTIQLLKSQKFQLIGFTIADIRNWNNENKRPTKWAKGFWGNSNTENTQRRRKTMILELHLIQNFAPSNLNRSDTVPKDCTSDDFAEREF